MSTASTNMTFWLISENCFPGRQRCKSVNKYLYYLWQELSQIQFSKRSMLNQPLFRKIIYLGRKSSQGIRLLKWPKRSLVWKPAIYGYFAKTLTVLCPQNLNHHIKNCVRFQWDSGTKYLTPTTEALNPRNIYSSPSLFKKWSLS